MLLGGTEVARLSEGKTGNSPKSGEIPLQPAPGYR